VTPNRGVKKVRPENKVRMLVALDLRPGRWSDH